MDRREFLNRAAAAAAALSLPASVSSCATAPLPAKRPNVLLIMADDLGYGDVGFTGRTEYATPAIDRLAREGVQLTQAYSAAPVCTPTRVALMTGRYPARYPVGLLEPLTSHPMGLAPEPATLSRLMKDAGYETALIGKWHLGILPEYHPLRHGFDDFYGFLGAAADYASHIDTEALKEYFYDGATSVHVEGYLTDLFTDRAVQYVSRTHDRPFFLNLQYNAPHWPWQGPGDPVYPDSLQGRTPGFPPRWRDGGSPEIYGRMVESMDGGIGRIMAALQNRGLDRDTLVIFTSDNGGERYSHMGPYSQGKMTLYEGGIHVAAAARWPGVIPAGSSTDQVAITMDWSATALALADATSPVPLDGIDLMPALKSGSVTAERELYWRISQRQKQKAMRRAEWKYLVTEAGEHLFDLAHDPSEKTDRKADQPQMLAGLRAAYAEWERQMLEPIPLEAKFR
jgi:arylsulfatase A-like enzyme